jgi:hypothetical protein
VDFGEKYPYGRRAIVAAKGAIDMSRLPPILIYDHFRHLVLHRLYAAATAVSFALISAIALGLLP